MWLEVLVGVMGGGVILSGVTFSLGFVFFSPLDGNVFVGIKFDDECRPADALEVSYIALPLNSDLF